MVTRLPEGTALNVYDERFEALLESEVAKLIRSANPRRARRLVGIMNEFRDAGGTVELQAYYKRVLVEALLDACAERL